MSESGGRLNVRFPPISAIPKVRIWWVTTEMHGSGGIAIDDTRPLHQ